MPRTARLDAPGVLNHVMIQGIERRKLFRNNKDREDFIKRLEILLKDKLLNFKRASRIQGMAERMLDLMRPATSSALTKDNGEDHCPTKACRRTWAFARAADAGRVCQAWHVASEVKVLTPGIRRAEG
jgi:hypothetical protein